MPEVTFLPNKITVNVAPGTELLDAIRQTGLEIEAPCGGKGSCGKCLVQIVSGEVNSDSLGLLSEEAVAEGFVLACKTQVNGSPVQVRIDEKTGKTGGKFLEDEPETTNIAPELLPHPEQMQPLVTQRQISIPLPQREDGLSDLDRLTQALGEKVTFSLPVLRKLADNLRENDGQITVTLTENSGQTEVIDVSAANPKNYGIAVDIGTTTVAVQLVALPDGEIIGTKSAYNEQISCGLDVISRINYARRADRLEELRTRILNTLNQLIEQLCQNHEISARTILSVAISGNTTMIHLLLGLKPEYIRLEPYCPTVHDVPRLAAAEVGVKIHPRAPIYFSPAVGSYVGGDITAGLLCTQLATKSEAISLFIDIGTNGELVIGNADFLMACACSAGPAFEGGGIRQGMRAAIGAIDKVTIFPDTGEASCRTIGNVPPRGICGSGMISLLAELFKTGWLDAAGKLNRQKASPSILPVNGRLAEYVLVPAEKSGRITISEAEIENIIRAKAAIYSAIALILEQIGLEVGAIDKIFIAGGFGRYLDLENAITIGLIPDLPREKFHYIGNSSLTGTYMLLVSAAHRKHQQELARKMTYLELNTSPDYMNQYTGALFLPHTDTALFPSVKI